MTAKHTFEQVMQAASAKAALRDALMASTPRPLVFTRRQLGPVLVSRCPTKLGQWRATTYNTNNEPTGHIEAVDFGAAIKHAVYLGGDPGTVRECLVTSC